MMRLHVDMDLGDQEAGDIEMAMIRRVVQGSAAIDGLCLHVVSNARWCLSTLCEAGSGTLHRPADVQQIPILLEDHVRRTDMASAR